MKKTILAITLLASILLTTVACGGSDDKGTTTTKGNDKTPGQTTTAPKDKPADPGETTPTDPGTTPNPGETTPTDPGTEPGTDPGTEPGSDPIFDDDEVDIFIVKGSAEIDGEKDESWNNAMTVTLDNVIKDNPSADTIVKASAMWDETAIYFLFEITDAQIFNGGAAGDYNNDGIYLYIAESMDIWASSADDYGFGAYQFALISKELEMLPRKNPDGMDLKAETAYNKTNDGMIIEFKYTFTTGELKNNAFIGLDYQYNDSETSGTRLGALNYYSSRVDGSWDTNSLAIAKLVETLPN